MIQNKEVPEGDDDYDVEDGETAERGGNQDQSPERHRPCLDVSALGRYEDAVLAETPAVSAETPFLQQPTNTTDRNTSWRV